jgi:thiaminase/transcriptional activator TenA
MSLSQYLWDEAIKPRFAAILEHPFLSGLTTGELPAESFRHYVLQDACYLRDFARGLAVLGARAEEDEMVMRFCDHAKNAILVERALHAGFLSEWGLSEEAIGKTEPAPNCLLYTSYLLRTAYTRPYFEALGAFLPCYWIYREVGRELGVQGSPNALYQRWIDTYAGDEFDQVVREMLAAVDSAGTDLTQAQRGAVAKHTRTTAELEWCFWDMGYRRQAWPLAGIDEK